MTTAFDYWLTLRASRDSIAQQFGVQAEGTVPETLRLADANLAISAILAKALVDHSVLTDTQVQTALTAAASGADGSVWSDAVTAPSGLTFDDFVTEDFEFGTSGDDVVAGVNTQFVRGQVGDSMLPSLGTITIAGGTHNGAKSGLTHTVDGWSRALRTDTYTPTATVYGRFYFMAAAPPATSGCRIFAFQRGPHAGTDIDADVWSLEVAVDSSGYPTLIDNGTARNPTSPPDICDGNWWRVEVALYGATCECRLWTGANVQGTTTPDFSWTDTYSAGPVDSAVVGQPRSALTSGQSWDTYHDDIVFSTSGWPPPF